MVAHYGRQAEPDGRISKQPIVYINHANSTCPQHPESARIAHRLRRRAPRAAGLRDAVAGAPRGAATDAGDAPRP